MDRDAFLKEGGNASNQTLKPRPCPFIQILSRFYPDFIQILSRFYPDFIQISLMFYPDFTLILSRFYPDFLKSHFIQILSRSV